MKPPTERQLYLLGFAKGVAHKGAFRSLWRVSDPGPRESLGTSNLLRPYEYCNPAKQPSRPELQKLIDLGWVELRADPGNYTENTLTGERRQHSRVWITEAGLAVLERVP
jgi:hypothetical protein